VILVVDNYDSFTYNLVQAIGAMTERPGIKVVLNDRVTIGDIENWRPTHIILSPGPCTPDEAGISLDVVRRLAGRVAILGVCLGHQCIGRAFGARVVRAGRVMHGKVSPIHHGGTGVFEGLPNPFSAARYHSLVLDPASLPPDFSVTAWTDGDEVMGIRHASRPLEGVQFHPESFLTPGGNRLLENFIRTPAAPLRPPAAGEPAGRPHPQAVFPRHRD
jgi:anthranilate synthase/aminodeoxychorismate synthase-like glutamine amidotransferase